MEKEDYEHQGGEKLVVGGAILHLPPEQESGIPDGADETASHPVIVGDFTRLSDAMPTVPPPTSRNEFHFEDFGQVGQVDAAIDNIWPAALSQPVEFATPPAYEDSEYFDTSVRRRPKVARAAAAIALLAIAVSAGKYAYGELTGTPERHLTAPSRTGDQLLQHQSDDNLLAVDPQQDNNSILDQLGDPTQTPTPTTSPTKSSPNTPSPTTAQKNTTAVSPSSTSTPRHIIVPPPYTPRATTPAASTPHSTAPHSSHTPEKVRHIGITPDKESINLLSKFASPDRANELRSNYQNVDDYLKLSNLNFLGKQAVIDYQNTLGAVYGDPQAHQILGNPTVFNAGELRDDLARGESPAGTAINFTDNILRNADRVYPIMGEKITKTAYLNNDLSSQLADQLASNEDVSVSTSENEDIIGEVQSKNGVAVVPMVAEYTKDNATYNDFIWGALMPVDTSGGFIIVDTFRQHLSEYPTFTPETPDPSPSDTAPTDTPTPTNTLYSEQDSHGHGHHKPKHD